MDLIDLRAYTTRAVELETAIYTQKNLMREHQSILKRHRPVEPQAPILQEPVKPTPPTAINPADYKIGCFGIQMLLGGISGIFLALVEPEDSAIAVAFGIIFLFVFLCSCLAKSNNKENAIKDFEIAQENYSKELSEYDQQIKHYQNSSFIANSEYQSSMQNWNVQVKEHDDHTQRITLQHNEALNSLEKALQLHYEQNIIFPKYRNMIAITMINEYLMSGRCYELEGPNGAYNLYELELRQNIIINQLSNIIDNLEQIRNNQFSLYQELVNANTTINTILSDIHGIHESTKLTAYFAGITALIEASPKVYIGRTYN